MLNKNNLPTTSPSRFRRPLLPRTLSPLLALLFFCPTSFALDVEADNVFHVQRVIDGDTLDLSNGERVRLIGIDTPELHHPKKAVQYFAEEAYQFVKQLVEGQEVSLEYDWEKKDKYGRTLAYIYRKSDNLFINAEIIKQGYGFAYTRFPFKYLDEFRQFEQNAREKELGLWKAVVGDDLVASFLPASYVATPSAYSQNQEVVYVGSRNSNKYHRPSCVWAKKINPNNLVTFSNREEAVSKDYIPCKVCKP